MSKVEKNVDNEKTKICISLFFIILLHCQKVTIAFWQSILANEILDQNSKKHKK